MTHILDLFDPSLYVQAFELRGTERIVTIDRVVGEEIIGDGGKKAHKPVVYFGDWPKPMILGKRLAKLLIKLFGTTDPERWSGRRITIYPDVEKIRGSDGMVEDREVVRIRKQLPQALPTPRTATVQTLTERLAAAVSTIGKATSQEKLEAIWKHARTVLLREELSRDAPDGYEQLIAAYASRKQDLEAS